MNEVPRKVIDQKLAQVYRVQKMALTADKKLEEHKISPCISTGIRRCLRALDSELTELGCGTDVTINRAIAVVDWLKENI